MSVHVINDNILDIYLKKEIIKDIDFKDKENLENYLKKIFRILKDKYDIKIEGYYEIDAYIDNNYGVILNLNREDFDYYDYFKNQVDMKISIIDNEFLYEVEDIPKSLLNKVNVIIEDDKIYLKINKKLKDIEMMKLLESSKIIYDR